LDSIVTAAWLFNLLEAKHVTLGSSPSAAFWKNAGLAHTHIVRNKGEVAGTVPLLFGATKIEDLRTLSAPEVVRLWALFASHVDASGDPSYAAIVSVLKQLRSSQSRRSQ
jgi:hypothetical protein